MNLIGDSRVKGVPAVLGTHLADGVAVEGGSGAGYGVLGHSVTNSGVAASSEKFHGVFAISHGANNAGLFGTNDAGGFGVAGVTTTGGTAVQGDATHGGRGVAGFSDSWQGVFGHSQTNAGVVGEADQFHGMFGVSHSANNAGVFGTNDAGGFGLSGISSTGVGVFGTGRVAGRFDGDVEVTGDIRLTNADGAEEFDIADAEFVEPGSVMVLGEEGVLSMSSQAYDKRVAGIVSGAGTYRPALVLDRQENRVNRLPIALFGKVFCKVDATYGTVAIGDLLTTSPTPGHAMKAQDSLSAFGAVIGKALRPLGGGQGLIPVLVSLQ